MGLKVKTKYLKNCVRLLSFGTSYDTTVVKEILDSETSLDKFYTPFIGELKQNLLDKASDKDKYNLITHYVYEFWDLQEFYKDICDDILVVDKTGKYGVKKDKDKLTDLETYMVLSYKLFGILFSEIQLLCYIYKIDFLRICDDLSFDTNLFFLIEPFKIDKQIVGEKKTVHANSPETFSDIFRAQGWEKYIKALEKTEPPLIDKDWNFSGKKRGHKGVVAAWIFSLQQNKGLINPNINRAQLATVLNNEIKNFNMGKDGKTFYNPSKLYDEEFKEQLIKLTR